MFILEKIVQEATEKWKVIKDVNKDIKLHLIGKLQTNKVKFCLPLLIIFIVWIV